MLVSLDRHTSVNILFEQKSLYSSDGYQCAIFCYVLDARSMCGLGVGVSLRHAEDSDIFDIRRGEKIALGRALEDVGLSKEARAKVWDKYFTAKNVDTND